MKSWNLLFCVIFFSSQLFGQKVDRVDPPFWFTNMNQEVLQLLLVGEDLVNFEVSLDYPDVSIHAVDHIPNNPSYALVYIAITENAQPGELTLTLRGKKKHKFSYELKRRSIYVQKGLDAQDVIGVQHIDSLDVSRVQSSFEELFETGYTCIAVVPFNGIPDSVGVIGVTDFYQNRSHFGKIDDLVDVQQFAHRKHIKTLRIEVLNQADNNHRLVLDPPYDSWILKPGSGHYDTTGYLQSNERATSIYDPHSSYIDRDRFTKGSLNTQFADWNHANDTLAEYLIQQSIWWQEVGGYDAVYLANYPDIDQIFMRIWRDRMLAEFPTLFVTGEVKAPSAVGQSWFLGESGLNSEFSSHLESVTDKELGHAISEFLRGDVNTIYRLMTEDFIYPNPNQLITSLSNNNPNNLVLSHSEIVKHKIALGILLTIRGIPQLSVPSISMLDNDTIELPLQRYTEKLLAWRRKNEPIKEGRFIQFVPENEVYTYVRDTERQAVLVVVNASDKRQFVNTRRFTEVTNGYHIGVDVVTQTTFSVFDQWELKPNEIRILELKRKPEVLEE
jgi:glycosidase